MRPTTPSAAAIVLAAAVFVAMALATTGVVRASGHQIIDTPRYQGYAEAMRSGLVPYRDFDFEYPPGALPLFALPAFAVSGSATYFWGFAGLMAAVGAVGVALVGATHRRLRRSGRAALWVLVLVALSPAAFGGVLLTRFDLVPAALAAGALLLLLGDRNRFASLTLGLAVAVKLYPLALLPLVAAWVWRRHGRGEAAISSALVVGVVGLAYLPFALLAPDEVTSSLWSQLSRPLQVESLGAGVLILLDHAVDLDVALETNDGSRNLVGGLATGVAVALSAATIAALCWLWVGFARGEASPERLARYGSAVVVALVAFGKVVSPQFLVWLVFPLALVAARRGAAAGACFAFAVVVTAVWFPWLYLDLARDGDPLVAALVVLRGVTLLGVFALLVWPNGGAGGGTELSRRG